MVKKTDPEASEGTENEGKARLPWKVKPPTMPPGSESVVKVRSLIGPSAGSDIELPYSAAQNAVAMGTAQRLPGVVYGPNFPGDDPAGSDDKPEEKVASGARPGGAAPPAGARPSGMSSASMRRK